MTLTEAISRLKPEEFNLILKNGTRKSVLCGYELNSLEYSSYTFVKEIAPDLIKNAKFDLLLFKLLKDRGYNVFEYDIENEPNAELMQSLCWVLDELERINEMEQETLSAEPETNMFLAGVERLNVFGVVNVLDNLSGGDVLKWDEIRKLPYHYVYFKQCKTNIENQIHKKYMELNKPKKTK